MKTLRQFATAQAAIPLGTAWYLRTVPATETSARMADLVLDWRHCQDEGWVPPLIALAAFNLDFLCIHRSVTAMAGFHA